MYVCMYVILGDLGVKLKRRKEKENERHGEKFRYSMLPIFAMCVI